LSGLSLTGLLKATVVTKAASTQSQVYPSIHHRF
jgi:hypothetical protein